MERTEGEPDVVGYDAKTDEYIFYDCSAESLKAERSLCYDREAWEARKQYKPEYSHRYRSGNGCWVTEERGTKRLLQEVGKV